MSINAQNRTLTDWFTRIRTRQIVLPRFQRFEAWGHSQVSQLCDTILQDLPIGAVLVLEIGDNQPFIARPMAGAPSTGERITEHLLDGQQRLTGLWRAMHNDYEEKTYFLCISSDEEESTTCFVKPIGRWRREGDTELRPFWANNPAEQWQRGLIPLDLCAPHEPNRDTPRLFRRWARAAIDDQEEQDDVVDQVSHIRGQFTMYNIPFLSLPVTTKPETALDVFIKVNTTSTPLSVYDIVVAQVEAAISDSLHDRVAETREACPSISSYYNPDELTLTASALIQGREPGRGTYMSSDFGKKMLDNWDQYIFGVKRAVAFLEEENVFDEKRLPTDVVVPLLVALWAFAPEGGDGEGRARQLLRKFLWRAFFSDRYERSTRTRSFADYNELLLLIKGKSTAKPPIFDDDAHPLPQDQELLSAGWPKRKDRLARAILSLALKHGGLDLADGSAVTRENLTRREYHHLFPEAHLTRLHVPIHEIYRSLNCALITWRTNRNISDKQPEKYLAERLENSGLDESQVKGRLSSHLIPYDEMLSGDYDAFLHSRANLMTQAANTLCV